MLGLVPERGKYMFDLMEEVRMNMRMLGRTAMRAGAVAICSAALCAVPMMAQGGGGGGRGMMDPDAQLAQLTTALTLSADQQAKIKPILAADAAKMQALMTAQDPDMRTKMTTIRTDEHTAIKALLTADQATKYDAMPQGRGGGRRGGGGAPGGAPPAAPAQ
jgi:protein CpxP